VTGCYGFPTAPTREPSLRGERQVRVVFKKGPDPKPRKKGICNACWMMGTNPHYDPNADDIPDAGKLATSQKVLLGVVTVVAAAVAVAPVAVELGAGCLATAPVCAAEIAEAATGGASGGSAVVGAGTATAGAASLAGEVDDVAGTASVVARADFNFNMSAANHYTKHVLGIKVGKKGKLTALAKGADMPEFRGVGGRKKYREAARTFMSGAGPEGSISLSSESGGMFRVDPKAGYFGYMNASGKVSTFYRPDRDVVGYFWKQFK
jgi:hypothetical protein